MRIKLTEAMPVYYLFEGEASDFARFRKPSSNRSDLHENDKILCRNCLQFITTRSLAIEVNGKHIHKCTNPHGYTFQFACYQEAAGCKEYGIPSLEDTWFDSYGWQLCVCRGCEKHMGWLYSAGDSFYGLILDCLLEENDSS